MRTPTKMAIALTVAIGALTATAIVAAAGSNTGAQRSSGAVPGDRGGSSSGPIAVDPIVPGPCGVPVTSGSGPDGTVSITPCPGDPSDPDPTPVPVQLRPTPGMDGVHPIGWDASSVGSDGSITLTFYTGVAPCSVLDHVDVAYGTDAVTITLFQGSDPSSRDVACIDIAMLASTTVRLDQPLGGRTILDGTGN